MTTASVSIDLCEFDADDLIRELEERHCNGLLVPGNRDRLRMLLDGAPRFPGELDETAARESPLGDALAALRRGDRHEALTILEWILPREFRGRLA